MNTDSRIVLRRVEVENFRSISRAVFTPEPTGVTALIGPTGSGKSSLLVDSLMWCLYGQTPAGRVTTRQLRREGTKGEPCRVEVELEIAGRVACITRQLTGLGDSTAARVTVDGHRTTIASARAATEWVTETLGLTCEEAKAALIVRQKELDRVVDDTPRDRRALIESLTGVDLLSQGLARARQIALDARRDLDRIEPVDPGEAQQAVELVEQSTSALVTAEHEHTRAVTLVDTCREQADLAVRQLRAARAAQDEHRRLETLAEHAEHEHAKTVQAANTAGDHAEALRALVVDHIDPQQARADHEQARRELEQARADIETGAAAGRELEQARADIETARHQLNTAETELAALNSRAPTIDPDRTSAQLAAAEDARHQASDRIAELRAEHRSISGQIELLDRHTGPNCPVCAQRVNDPARILNQLRAQLHVVETTGGETRAELERITTTCKQLRDQLDQEISIRARHAEATRRAGQAVETARDILTRTEAKLEQTARRSGPLIETGQHRQRDIPRMETAVDETGRAWADARAGTQTAARAAEATEQARRARETAARAAETARTARNAADTAETIDPETITRLETAERTRAAEHADARAHVERTSGALELARRVAAEHEHALSRLTARQAARVEQAAETETAAAVRDGIESFRAERLATLGPALAELAGSHLSGMSGGRFPAVELDDDFGATVICADGTRRAADLLSGGQRSALALALRIAIRDLVAPGGLLVLDEVTPHADAEWRQAIQAVIRGLDNTQILMTSHFDEITDIADTVWEVLPDPGGAGVNRVGGT